MGPASSFPSGTHTSRTSPGIIVLIVCVLLADATQALHCFNNIRFVESQKLNDISAAHVVISYVPSDILKGRLLNGMFDHPRKHANLKFTLNSYNVHSNPEHLH